MSYDMQNNQLSQFSLDNNYDYNQFNKKIFVEQGKVKISKLPLFTKGLGTCSTMIFKIGKKKYLTHVDINTSYQYLLNNINSNFNKNQLNKIDFIYICSGKWKGNKNTRIIILKVINHLKMIHKIIELKKINYEDSIGINKKGVWIEKHFEKNKIYY